ncbi:MAG: hypothetical protein J6866_05905, partial [Victivallales bacterium]|nr:hypothetical protein [Victivallales bacterium]
MAGIDGIGGGKVDWNALLNSISGDAKVEGGGDVQPRGNLVLSDSDKELLLTLLTTPDIDAPAGGENASETLQSLIDKLQDGKTFNFDEEQTKVFVNTLNAVMAKVNGAA